MLYLQTALSEQTIVLCVLALSKRLARCIDTTVQAARFFTSRSIGFASESTGLYAATQTATMPPASLRIAFTGVLEIGIPSVANHSDRNRLIGISISRGSENQAKSLRRRLGEQGRTDKTKLAPGKHLVWRQVAWSAYNAPGFAWDFVIES
jgi:hypothetical protein